MNFTLILHADKDEGKVDVQNMMAALAVALGICSMGVGMAGAGGAEASLATACIIVTTLWVVLLATIFPSSLRPLASSGETLGIMLIQVNNFSISFNLLRFVLLF